MLTLYVINAQWYDYIPNIIHINLSVLWNLGSINHSMNNYIFGYMSWRYAYRRYSVLKA